MPSKKYYKRKGARKSKKSHHKRHRRTRQGRRLRRNKTRRRTAGMLGRLTGSKSKWNPPPRNTTNSYTREIVEEKLRRMREKRMKEEEYNKQHNITPHNIEKTEVRAQKAAERAQEAVNIYLFNLNWIKQARLAKEKLTEQKIKEIEHFIKTAPNEIHNINKLKQEFEALKQDIKKEKEKELADFLHDEFDT